MRLSEITFKPNRQIQMMSDADRHAWLKFIAAWYGGSQMMNGTNKNVDDGQQLAKWQQLSKMFPPKVPSQVSLFRLVTVPMAYAKRRQFTFKPAPGKVSSWTRRLVGLDSVAGVATDMLHNYGSHKDRTETARIGIEATISGSLVLATPNSIRNAFMTLSHDYFQRYPEKTEIKKLPNGRTVHRTIHPGYPGGDDPEFTMDDVDSYQDVLNRPGGNYRQYEYIVQTPPQVDATVVQIYRLGNDTVRVGNDDPHGGYAPRIRRLRPKD